ncbi:sugar ABC transporter permease [Paenibacillus antri]|uniref:Sugar ABC transporter permease n=2 Tax=Paenibacillus antri TaxID=2582848 RepID=A0A5R9FW96_9BACL|nr:sugar ABC transporter permease [Paenibacillus antri]
MRRDRAFYMLLAPAILIVFVFAYMPIPGILVAFKDYKVLRGFWGSEWVGLANIEKIFVLPNMILAIWNTFWISLLSLVFLFPAPIALALLLNEVRVQLFKRVVQTLFYLPHFLSWISVIGIAYAFYSIYGPLNDLRVALGGEGTERIMFMAEQSMFVPNVILLNLWKEVGWGTIIFLAAIASVDPQLYEAAHMDGANRLQQAWHITLPSIMPTVMILLILQLGNLFNVNFELIYGLQNPFINFEVIQTIVFKFGIQQGSYAIATALGFVQGIIALVLTIAANYGAKKASGVGIW